MALYDFIYRYKINLFKTDGFDDLTDRLTYKYSCYIFLLASMVSLTKQYLFNPISCYIANEAGGNKLINYIENYCWVEGTIPFNLSNTFPRNENEWRIAEQKKILYYQWIPFIFPLQAIACYLPQLLWKLFYINNNGKKIDNLLLKANKAVTMDEMSRKKEVKHLAKVLELILFETREDDVQSSCGVKAISTKIYEYLILGKRLGAYLIVFYWFIKMLYFFNAVVQLIFIQCLLEPVSRHYHFFGKEIIYGIFNEDNFQKTEVFPILGFCAVKFRHLGSTNFVIAQCALPFNVINKNIFRFLWFWFLILSTISAISIVIWLCESYLQYNKTAFLNKYLKISDKCNYKELQKALIKKFEKQFLKHNGIFILKMIAINSGDLITADIVNQLWTVYKEKYALKMFNVTSRRKHQKRSSDNNSIQSEKDNFLLKLSSDTKNPGRSSVYPNAPPEKGEFSNV